MLKGVDLALEALAAADGDPERAIALAREWILVGPPPDGMSETELKQLSTIASGKAGS
jgi:hypothetical protein